LDLTFRLAKSELMIINKMQPFRLYRQIEPDEHICIFADPAEGIDYCAAVGFSKKHQDLPIVYNEKIESSQFGHELHHMAKFIEAYSHLWPTIGVERNTGQATIYVLTTLNYPELFRMRIFDKSGFVESEKIGWTTSEPTRKKMLDDYALAVRQGTVKVYDKEVVDQMRSFIVDKKGKARAESNKHDDLVMAAAGAYQIAMLTPTRESDEFDEESWKRGQEKWRFK
jgi:hypothetical protein